MEPLSISMAGGLVIPCLSPNAVVQLGVAKTYLTRQQMRRVGTSYFQRDLIRHILLLPTRK